MASDNKSLDTIVCTAVEIASAQERVTFIAQACGDDRHLKARVERLVAAHFGAGSFLEKPVAELLAEDRVNPDPGTETEGDSPAANQGDEDLCFLAPTEKPGVLGTLGHYDILEVIGRGGMGIVLRAFDAKLHRVVAIKVMAAQLATSGTARQRFTREAQAAAAVSHDHIVTIHAVEEAAGHPYLVMQYVSGLSLQQRLDRDGPLQLPEILRVGMQTAAGLAAAHAQGLVHRDVKPANILLENGVERVKITDFGLARAAADASLTQSGVVAGTPQYMSPEQAEGGQLDQRTDLFSLGSVLYAMCTGRAPFRASGSMAVLKRVCEETPRPIRETNTDIPDWLVAIIDKLHAKAPAGRYQTAAEVAELLNQHLAHLQHPSLVPLPVTRPAKPPSAGRRRLLTALALVSLIAGTIILIAAVTGFLTPEDTSVVNDRPAAKAPSSGTAPKPDPHPFVILGGKGVAVGKFDTLAEAVQRASDGDTIEIRGNGPFVSEHISRTQALTIRAATGFRPVIKLGPKAAKAGLPLLEMHGTLVLEGLELHRGAYDDTAPAFDALVDVSNAEAYFANCRFVTMIQGNAILARSSPSCQVRNCEFLGKEGMALLQPPSQAHYVIDNCIQAGGGAFGVHHSSETCDASMVLSRNTAIGYSFFIFGLKVPPDSKLIAGGAKPLYVNACANVFGGRNALFDFVQWGPALLEPKEGKGLLLHFLRWQEAENVSAGTQYATTRLPDSSKSQPLAKSAKDWQSIWNLAKTDSLEGQLRFQGGDLWSKANGKPLELTPEDFHLRPDSAGYKAGKDGKDLGADVDLVGPGPAYERWKKTSEYQKWLKDTEHVVKAEAPKAEPKPFVLQGGKGVPERKFDTLAEAFQGASDGDTVEIRGNGPFVTQPISIENRALTIRAGKGFWPVIKADPGEKADSLLQSNSLLVLEGLDLQWVEAKPFDPSDPRYPRLVVSSGPAARLHAVNCRFLMNRREGFHNMTCIGVWDGASCHLRNCQLLGAGHGSLSSFLDIITGIPNTTVVVDNCLIIGHGTGFNVTHAEPTKVVLNQNTFLGPYFVNFHLRPCRQ